MTYLQNILASSLSAILLWGCAKQDAFLDKKYNLADVVPQTVEQFQALLDNEIMNNALPSSGLMGTDNFYVQDEYVSFLQPVEKNTYLWVKDILEGGAVSDWPGVYTMVMYANTVLEGLNKLTEQATNPNYQQVKGSALYFRAFAFYHLAQTYAKPYSTTASEDLGIILRTTSEVHAPAVRATVAETYAKIITDLEAAEALLPEHPLKTNRPSRGAVYGLLAKTYLHMGDYAKVEDFATRALAINHTLLDFNDIEPGQLFPFLTYAVNHPEYVFYATANSYEIFQPFGVASVDTVLYASYETNDLRKTIFYVENPGSPTVIGWFGNYTIGLTFAGIATNELYLMLAEAQVRQNKVTEGLTSLNTLLEKRFLSPYTPKTAGTLSEALSLVLQERRKELPFTAQIRWEDLRRLNLDPAYAITLTRQSEGQTYTLAPNDPKYVLPIPDDEIQMSGIQQNTR